MSPEATNRMEVRLRDLAQLFNSMDPSPFVDRDLDAGAEEFIVSWARELPHHREFELMIHVAEPPSPERAAGVEEAVRHYFQSRAMMKQRESRAFQRRARTSLLTGLVFLAACFGASELARNAFGGTVANFVELGLQIAGWVAMWRPLEMYLYDWWPIRAERLLLERLGRMHVELHVGTGS